MTRARDVANIDGVLTTTGDTYYASAAATPARLGIGSTGNVLTVAGGVPVWSAPAGGGKTWTLLTTTSMSGSSSVTVSGISNKEDILVLIKDATCASIGQEFLLRINGDSNPNIRMNFAYVVGNTSWSTNNVQGRSTIDANSIVWAYTSTNAGSLGNATIAISGCKSTGMKNFSYSGGPTPQGGNGQAIYTGQGIYNASAAVTSITVVNDAGLNFNGGTIYVYGA